MACTRSAIHARLSPPAAAHSAETASPHPAETGIREPRLRLRSEPRLRCGSEITSGAEAGDHRRRSHPVGLAEIAGRAETRHSRSRSDAVSGAREGMTATEAVR